ncbi:hypothetical protein, partial [Pseudomonas piscis]|uniref:hypothetical protein n=1 Tax=Pseudomonas piscis TaxID=2614538 RepID=UPI0012FF45F7
MSPDHTPSRKRLMLLGIGGLSLAALLVASGLAARTPGTPLAQQRPGHRPARRAGAHRLHRGGFDAG